MPKTEVKVPVQLEQGSGIGIELCYGTTISARWDNKQLPVLKSLECLAIRPSKGPLAERDSQQLHPLLQESRSHHQLSRSDPMSGTRTWCALHAAGAELSAPKSRKQS